MLKSIDKAKENFKLAMNDDFNTSLALAEIFELVGAVNFAIADSEIDSKTSQSVKDATNTIIELLGVFGIEFSNDNSNNNDVLIEVAEKLNIDYSASDDVAQAILDARANARANKDWDLADGIRDAVAQVGLTIEDTPQGSRIV